MPAQFAAQGRVLLRQALVTVRLAPGPDRVDRPGQSGLGGLALYDPVPFARPAPVVRKAKETEASGLVVVAVATGSGTRSRTGSRAGTRTGTRTGSPPKAKRPPELSSDGRPAS